jgi:hypothetical protein
MLSNGQIKRSDLPFGSEFSPVQINLPQVLELAANNTRYVKWIEFLGGR